MNDFRSPISFHESPEFYVKFDIKQTCRELMKKIDEVKDLEKLEQIYEQLSRTYNIL